MSSGGIDLTGGKKTNVGETLKGSRHFCEVAMVNLQAELTEQEAKVPTSEKFLRGKPSVVFRAAPWSRAEKHLRWGRSWTRYPVESVASDTCSAKLPAGAGKKPGDRKRTRTKCCLGAVASVSLAVALFHSGGTPNDGGQIIDRRRRFGRVAFCVCSARIDLSGGGKKK